LRCSISSSITLLILVFCFVLVFAFDGVLEILDALSQAFAQFRQFFAAEKQCDNDHDQQYFPNA
jgi:uncharacterized membrane protein